MLTSNPELKTCIFVWTSYQTETSTLGAWGGRCLSSFIIYVFQNCMQRSVSSQFYVAQVNVMCARTMFNMYVQFSLYRMASVPVSVITICRKVISPQLLEIMESGLHWIYAHCVTIYWWRAYHLVIFCSISWFLEVSLVAISSDLLVTIVATAQWGFISTLPTSAGCLCICCSASCI